MEENTISEVRIHQGEVTVGLIEGERYRVRGVLDQDLLERLTHEGVQVDWGEEKNPLWDLLITLVPVIFFVGLFIYFIKRLGGGGANMMERTLS